MKNSKCLVTFPSSVNSPFSSPRVGLQTTLQLCSLPGEGSPVPKFVTEPGGVEGYLYIHVQTVVKSNVIKIDLLTLSLAYGLVSVKAAGQ